MPKKKTKAKDVADKEAVARPDSVDGNVALKEEEAERPAEVDGNVDAPEPTKEEEAERPVEVDGNVDAPEPTVVHPKVRSNTRAEEAALRIKIKAVVKQVDALKVERSVAELGGHWIEHEKLDGKIRVVLDQRTKYQDRLNEIYRPRRAPLIVRGLKNKNISTKTLIEQLQRKAPSNMPYFVRNQLREAWEMEEDPAIGRLADLRRFPTLKMTMDGIFSSSETSS